MSRQAVYNLKKAAASLSAGTVPMRIKRFRTKRKTSPRTDKVLKHKVLANPSVTAAILKKKHSDFLDSVSIHTLQHHLQNTMPPRIHS